MSIPKPLEEMIRDLASLPGLGRRSATRAALHLLTHDDEMRKIQAVLTQVKEQVKTCQECGNVGLSSPCHICKDDTRDISILCVVEGVDDLWAMERSNSFGGFYHVLGGVVSAINGVGPDDIRLSQLVDRVANGEFNEVILALGASVDGQTTSHLISRRLQALNKNVRISTLARGIPVGAEVDYMDDGTLSLALRGRIEI